MLLTLVERLARFMAIVGGLVLTALIALTCVSVLGRGLNTLGHSELLTSASESLANALIATGHSMLGLSLGPVTGRLIADLADEKNVERDISRLSPARFS